IPGRSRPTSGRTRRGGNHGLFARLAPPAMNRLRVEPRPERKGSPEREIAAESLPPSSRRYSASSPSIPPNLWPHEVLQMDYVTHYSSMQFEELAIHKT